MCKALFEIGFLQHIILSIEGFARGGSPEEAFAEPASGASAYGLQAAQGIFMGMMRDAIRPQSLEAFARKV